MVVRKITQGLEGLDHVFFSGEVDREVAIESFNLPREKTTYCPFGVDSDFWHPGPNNPDAEGILSIGSDINRDFQTLMDTDVDDPIRIITRLNIEVPPGKSNIELVRGNLTTSPITDADLRDMYHQAKLVVVPLNDVWQPTGCSVTLQAMACGRPVIVSDIKGLWDRDVLRSGENCMLVPPNDPEALSTAIRDLNADPELCTRMGHAARKTVEDHLSIGRMDQTLENMILAQSQHSK